MGPGAVRAVGVPVVLAVLVCACGSTGPDDARLVELEAHLARWDSVGPASYQYAVARSCFCPLEYLGPVRVRVEDGEVAARVYVDSGTPVPSGPDEAFPAVDGLFALLRSAVERGADRIDVTYDPDLGVPLDLWIDYSEAAADEELGMSVTEPVTPIP